MGGRRRWCAIDGCDQRVKERCLCEEHAKTYFTRAQAIRFLKTKQQRLLLAVANKLLPQVGAYHYQKFYLRSDLEALQARFPRGLPTPGRKKWTMSDAKRAERLEELRASARSRGGELVSKEYKGIRSRYMWRCAEGHTWSALASNVKCGNKSWCPKCFFASIAERRRKRASVWR